MTEDEWFSRGEKILENWQNEIDPEFPNLSLTHNEESAFEYAWELAGREMGIVK